MQQNMHPADADRYANLNTILGYDVGKDIFTAIDSYVWEHDYDLLELSGSKEDKNPGGCSRKITDVFGLFKMEKFIRTAV